MTTTKAIGQTLFDKIWERHRIFEREDGQVLLYVDRHFIHDVSQSAFEMLHGRNLKTRSPERTIGAADHYVPTDSRGIDNIVDPERRNMAEALMRDAARHGIPVFGPDHAQQGIVHVVGPEQGLTQPGALIVCGDSHTSTHGALGALAFGIGMTEVAHVLATQAIWQRKSKVMRIKIDGQLGPGVSAKDVILAIIAQIGAGGATGHVIEYDGSTIRKLSIESRLTICNMSIEAGGRAGFVAPDDTTFHYLADRPSSPKGEAWDRALTRWRTLPSDEDAIFDREVTLSGSAIAPMVTWGNSPEDALPIDGRVPDPSTAETAERRDAIARTLRYMGLQPGMPLTDIRIDRVFIGSCTNGRIEDLRSAASVLRGRKVTPGVTAWVVPGSGVVKAQAEAEGLAEVFTDAGFEWRHSGCSMCLGTNGDILEPGQRSASTTNRNFVGRQGPGSRTHLLSPAMAAAAAIVGRFTDVRRLAPEA
jgi:3-isopropylmalate/(R)-2-methylmalate dehydratase large subunit